MSITTVRSITRYLLLSLLLTATIDIHAMNKRQYIALALAFGITHMSLYTLKSVLRAHRTTDDQQPLALVCRAGTFTSAMTLLYTFALQHYELV